MVMIMRRVLSALAAAGVLAFGFLLAASASAAPDAPVSHPSLSVSTTSPCVGQAIEVGGTNFAAGETITLSIGDQAVGTATTGATGSFDPSVDTPDLVGEQQLVGVGQSSGRQGALTLRIRRCSAAAGESVNGGALALTGVEIAGLSLLAAVLVAGGAVFVSAGRRASRV
jgi:hypothetical protein